MEIVVGIVCVVFIVVLVKIFFSLKELSGDLFNVQRNAEQNRSAANFAKRELAAKMDQMKGFYEARLDNIITANNGSVDDIHEQLANITKKLESHSKEIEELNKKFNDIKENFKKCLAASHRMVDMMKNYDYHIMNRKQRRSAPKDMPQTSGISEHAAEIKESLES